jgi:prepilin-type N-terminal cleavage/methylation domain-containing protein
MNKFGFTLVEILIVIGIVGTLLAVSTAAYGSHMKNTRDTRRKLDLKEISLSLEKYHTDNSEYPKDLNSLKSEGYMPEIPKDPISPQQDYSYKRNNDDTYELKAIMENQSDGKYYIVKTNESSDK